MRERDEVEYARAQHAVICVWLQLGIASCQLRLGSVWFVQ